MKSNYIQLSTGRRTNRVSYKERGTVVSKSINTRANISTYLAPSFDSEHCDVALIKQFIEKQKYVPTNPGDLSQRPLWQQVTETVILCSKKSLHY